LLFYQDWRLAALALVALPPGAAAIRNLGKRMRKASTVTQVETGTLGSLLEEVFQGIRLVRSYGMEGYEIGRTAAAVEARLVALLKVARTRAASGPVVEFLGSLAIA